MNNLEKTIDELLKDNEKSHSQFQIENFIIGSKGNRWAQYKQCLREIDSRRENIRRMKNDRTILIAEIGKLKDRWFVFGKWRRMIHKAKLNQRKLELKELDSSLMENNRELIIFAELAQRIKKQSWGNEKLLPPLKRKLEAEMWREKAMFHAAVDCLTTGALSRPTVELIFSMPRDIRKELVKYTHPNSRDKLIEWIKA